MGRCPLAGQCDVPGTNYWESRGGAGAPAKRLGGHQPVGRSFWGRPLFGSVALTVIVGASLLSSALLSNPAAASTRGCGTLPSDTSVYVGKPGSCSVPPATRPYVTFGDGERIDLAMGPNSIFSPKDHLGGDIEAILCEYTTGFSAGDPPNANYCDAQSLAGDWPYTVHSDGSFDYTVDNRGDAVTMFNLPGKFLKTSPIKCDATHACVWYIGENYNDFTTPHVFSEPFFASAAPSSGGSSTWIVILVLVLGLGGAGGVVWSRRRRRSTSPSSPGPAVRRERPVTSGRR